MDGTTKHSPTFTRGTWAAALRERRARGTGAGPVPSIRLFRVLLHYLRGEAVLPGVLLLGRQPLSGSADRPQLCRDEDSPKQPDPDCSGPLRSPGRPSPRGGDLELPQGGSRWPPSALWTSLGAGRVGL